MLSFIANTKATAYELEQLKQSFLLMDVNKDGRLSFEEVKQGVDKLEGSNASFRFSKTGYISLMQSIDKDRNGYVDYQEFISAAVNKAALVNRENLSSTFRTFDRDCSGMISVDELKGVFESADNKKDADLWVDIMREVDKNGDNMISFEEFAEVMQSKIIAHSHVSTRTQTNGSPRMLN